VKRIAILQPSYLPWLGFFEQFYRCDIFVFLDDVKYTKLDWRNRNRFKTPNGTIWLTIPVFTKGKEGQKINETRIDNTKKWQVKHRKVIEFNYKKSPYFNAYFNELKSFYKKKYEYLCDLNIDLILWINEKIGLKREHILSSQLGISQKDKQDRLIEICKSTYADYLYDGKSSENFINKNYFYDHGINVEFQEYEHPYYNQQWLKEQGFISHLSVIDLLFNYGPDSLDIITGQKRIPLPEGIEIKDANL
jgi:hypothetical protein